MGRKPHKLVQEYFERGAKLEDSSNRYQHTCRSCGEKFPKGRIDGLTSHLLKRCPGISPETRQKIIQELSEKPNQNGTYNQLALAMRNEQVGGDLTFAPNPNMSALETLAEVSRQQLDTSGDGQPLQSLDTTRKRKRGRASAAQQQFQTTFQIRNDQFDPQLLGLGEPSQNVNDATHEEILRGINQFTEQQKLNEQASQGLSSSAAPTARMVPDQLALAASAANDMMPGPDATTDDRLASINVDQHSRGTGNLSTNASQAIDPQLEEGPSQSQSSQLQIPINRPLMLGPRALGANPNLPHVHYMNDFSILGDQPNKRVRGRFSDIRRKEVQEVRKQGACIRCRMLKKPCSEGTPCNTCQNVESARLWKHPCMRARIADEFDLYSAGVQSVIAFHETSQAKKAETFHSSPNKIEATHFPGSATLFAKFNSVRGEASDVFTLEPDLPENSQSTVEIELIDAQMEEVGEELRSYFKLADRSYFEHEPSNFMRPTLILANDLVSQRKDPLLSRALALWISTQVLVDPNAVWFLSSVPISSDAIAVEETVRREISPSNDRLSHRLITQQLHGHTEKYAAQVAKSLINDLERRLLQRQQASAQHFETFLTAIIVLNCVEKMCWLYSTWASKFSSTALPSDTADDVDILNSDADLKQTEYHERGRWPLEDRTPQTFVEKGESIAGVVAMLLKMRGIPPVSVVGDGGFLRADLSNGAASRREQSQSQSQMQAQNPSTEDLITHLAQAAAATANESDPTSPGQDQDDLSALASSPHMPDQDTTQLQTSTRSQGSRQATMQGDSSAQNSVVAAWFESVNVTKEQLKTAQTAETWDEKDCRCWELRYISRLFLPDE